MGSIFAPDSDVLEFKTKVAILFMGAILTYVLAVNLNLLLGLEKEHPAVVKSVISIPGSKPRLKHVFVTKEGETYEREMRPEVSRRFALEEGEEVTIKTDGLFVVLVGVDKGEGFIEY